MKQIILFITLFSLSGTVQSQQYHLNLYLNPNVSTYVDEWIEGNMDAYLEINQIGGLPSEHCLLVEIYKDDALVARSDEDQVALQPIDLMPGTNVITPDMFTNLLEFDEGAFSEEEQNYFWETRRFPSGNYSICVYLRTCDINNPISIAEGCFPMFIIPYLPSSLLFPENNYVLAKEQNPWINFQWTSLIPAYPAPIEYQIRLFEQYEGQTKEQALLVNPLIWEATTPTTNISYDMNLFPLEEEENYVWQVQVIDEQGNGIGETGGFSEVCDLGLANGH